MWEWLTAIPLLRMLPYRRALLAYRTHAVQSRIREVMTFVSSSRDLEADRLMVEPCFCDHKLLDHYFWNHEFGMRIVCSITGVTCLTIQAGNEHENLQSVGDRIASRYHRILGSNRYETEA